MSELNIRQMEKSDVKAVSEIEQKTFSQPWSEQGFLDALEGGNALYYVAEIAGRIVGYCGMYCAQDEGEIVNVAVEETVRQKGIGKRMLTEMKRAAKEIGIHTILLEVRISNIAAIRLYEDMGFHILGTRKNFYEFPQEDGFVMSLRQ